MNSLQIEINRDKDNTPVLLDQQKTLESVQKASEGVKVHQTEESVLKQFLSTQIMKSFVLLGINKPSEQDCFIILTPLYKEIRKNFSSLTGAEIETAFEMGIYGEFGEINSRLPASTFVKFLKSYKHHKESTNFSHAKIKMIYDEQKETQEAAEQIKRFNQEFLSQKYKEFCELVQEGQRKVNSSVSFSLELSKLDIDSYTSAIKENEGGFLISPNQLKWIDEKIKSLSFEFDPYKFGRGLDSRRKFNQFKNIEKSRVEKSLFLQLHFANKVAQNTGVSINDFLNFTF